jgi:hypothetical protein
MLYTLLNSFIITRQLTCMNNISNPSKLAKAFQSPFAPKRVPSIKSQMIFIISQPTAYDVIFFSCTLPPFNNHWLTCSFQLKDLSVSWRSDSRSGSGLNLDKKSKPLINLLCATNSYSLALTYGFVLYA